MPNRRRRLKVAAPAAFILAVTSSALAAQETNTVGPPQLKDFSLPGQRTTPPVQQPTPQPATPVPARPSPVSAAPAATAPAATGPARTTRRERPETPRASTPVAAASRPSEAPQDSAANPPASLPTATTAPSPTLPAAQPPAPAPAVATPDANSSINWLWIGGAALLALFAFFGLRRLAAFRDEARRRARREERAAARAAEIAPPAEPEPAPAETGPRARLELSFTADRAVATETETIVHYEMVLRNLGEETARNIRIDVRMFNAGAKPAVAAFLNGAIHAESGSPHVTIPPAGELKLTSSIAMPKDEVKGIEVQGRSIFVPIVAINTAYDWGSGDQAGGGRTSRSWLVGREPQPPSDKMGAFRLDLGPRIYRSVGQRPTELANVA